MTIVYISWKLILNSTLQDALSQLETTSVEDDTHITYFVEDVPALRIKQNSTVSEMNPAAFE